MNNTTDYNYIGFLKVRRGNLELHIGYKVIDEGFRNLHKRYRDALNKLLLIGIRKKVITLSYSSKCVADMIKKINQVQKIYGIAVILYSDDFELIKHVENKLGKKSIYHRKKSYEIQKRIKTYDRRERSSTQAGGLSRSTR